jgi:hypothetical protein
MARSQRRRKERFPWLLLLLLLGSVYLFWGLPYQLGSRPVQVDFVEAAGDQ